MTASRLSELIWRTVETRMLIVEDAKLVLSQPGADVNLHVSGCRAVVMKTRTK